MSKFESVAAYIRVSSEEQKLHGISLDAQVMKLTEYADAHQLKIVEWYKDEGVSGRKLIRKRPELQRMLNDAKKGLFERIIFIKLDRFFRSVAEYHECMKMIEPVVWTATEEKYDLTTASGRAFVNMKLTIAELEADQTGERIAIVNDYKIKNGQAISGAQPLGYKTAKIDGVKRVIKDEKTAAIVEWALNHYMVHQNKREVVTMLNNQYGVNIPYDSFTRLLANPLYKGEYRGNKEYCEPYLTPDQWAQLQEVSKRRTRKKQTQTYIFAGLMRCPECGILLAGSQHIMKRIKKDGSPAVYLYHNYRCANHRLRKTCQFKSSVFENNIEKQLCARIDEYLEGYEVRCAEMENRKIPEKKLDAKIIKAEMDRLNYAWQKNRISVEEYDRRYDELTELLKDIPEPRKVDVSKAKKALSGDWLEVYREFTEDNKKAFWRGIIKEIRIDGKEITEVDFF